MALLLKPLTALYHCLVKPRQLSKALVAGSLGLVISGPAAARDPDQAYHVEVVVFKQYQPGSGLERPRQNLALSYPPNYKVIAPPKPEAEIAAEIEAVNSTGDAETANALAEESGLNVADAYANERLDAFAEPELNPLRVLYERPKNRYKLLPEARAINRQNNYEVLFHKAWTQNFSKAANEPHIVINGGERFDERSELGGTIKLSINKFIHLDTQLWLAEFTPNLGQETPWQHPPLAPTGLITQNSGFGDNNNQVANTSAPTRFSFDDGFSGRNLTGTNQPSERSNNAAGSIVSGSVLSNRFGDGTGFQGIREQQGFTSQQYAVTKTVQLLQSRRMRSTEMHYIDHPNLGILIRVDPIEGVVNEENL